MAITIEFDGKQIYTENRYNYSVVYNFTPLENTFVQHVKEILLDCYNDDFPIRIERHSDSYLTMMVGEHSDFLRFKCTERTKWFSVALSNEKRKEEGVHTRFTDSKPSIRHWKSRLNTVDDVTNYNDIIKDAYLFGVYLSNK